MAESLAPLITARASTPTIPVSPPELPEPPELETSSFARPTGILCTTYPLKSWLDGLCLPFFLVSNFGKAA